MNARKMSKTKKPAKAEAPTKNAQANKSAKRSAASAEFDDEDEPGTSKRPRPGATSATKAKAAKSTGKAKGDSVPAAGKAKTATSAGKATSPGKAKAATSAGKATKGKAAATTSPGKAKAATSAGKAKAATKGKAAGSAKGASAAKASKTGAGKATATESKGARGAAKRKGGETEAELAAGEVELDVEHLDDGSDNANDRERDREADAGTITDADDWLDEAQDDVDSAARGERGDPLLSDISEIRAPREDGAAAPELAEGEVALADDISADTQPAPTTRAHLKRVVESLIFVADQAVSANQLGRLVKAKAAEVREVVTEIMRDYDGRGIELVEVSGGFQFRSAAASAPFVRDLVSARPIRLTKAQLETLALIAYRQPITRPEIDDVRGVDSGSAIKVLLDRDLVKILGRKDEAGRPLLYGTAPQFLDFFGMNTLQDLPTLREFTELSEENRELFAKKMGEVPEDLSDPAFEPVVQHAQEYDDEGNPITPTPELDEGSEAGSETQTGDDREEGHVLAEDSEIEIEARQEREEPLKQDEDDEDEVGDESEEAVDQLDDDADEGDEDEGDSDEDDADDEDDESDDEDEEADEDDEAADESGEAVDQLDDADEPDEDKSDDADDEDDESDDEDEEADDDDEATDESGEAVDQVDADEGDEDDEDEDEDEDADDEDADGDEDDADDDEDEDADDEEEEEDD